MLMGGLLDMIFSQIFSENSLIDSLKRTMANQEIIFKEQVTELHRLYAIQKSLTKGDDVTLGPSAKDIRCEILRKKRPFQENLTQTPIDLRLLRDDKVLGENKVNLALSIGMGTNKRSSTSMEALKNKINYRSSEVIIDLEESAETTSNEESFNQGSNEYNGVRRIIAIDLDLNKDQSDESSFQSNESCVYFSPRVKPIPKQPKSQNKLEYIEINPCAINLESMAEPSSDISEEKEQKFSALSEKVNRTEKSTEAYMVQKAAMSLICISLERSPTSNQDSITKSSSNFIENEEETKKKRRQFSASSMDSYELLVLKLEETGVDEDCVTSKAYAINEFEKKNENKIKLRRGRRLKDFQKDVLPTLSTLSRHEIWEDVKIMQGVIRSREYKRLHKAETANTENLFRPNKNRRSKVNRVGRRHYS